METVKLKVSKDKENNDFVKRCIFNTSFPEYMERAMYHLDHSKNSKDFIKNYLYDRKLTMSQGYAELSKITEEHWYRVRQILGDSCKKAVSDAGGLKIGNDDFTLLIPNGYGDGITRFGFVDDFNTDMMNYFTRICGKFNVYGYDCGDNQLVTIEGDYGVFYYQGIVIFKKY